MIIPKGTQQSFEMFLKDDSGNVITDLTNYAVSIVLGRDDTVVYRWLPTGDEAIDNEHVFPITIETSGSGAGKMTFWLLSTMTQAMEVADYIMEARIENSADSTVVIKSAQERISIATSLHSTI